MAKPIETVDEANRVLIQIFERALKDSFEIEAILNGCRDSHRFAADDVCRGCGRHRGLVLS